MTTPKTSTATVKKSFLLYKDSAEIIEAMTVTQAGKYLKAIYHYHSSGEVVDIGPDLKLLLLSAVATFKRDDEKYASTCASRSKAGIKGAKQKLANAGKRKQKVATQADIDIDIVIESDIEIDNKLTTTVASAPPEGVNRNFILKSGAIYQLAEGDVERWTELHSCDVEFELMCAADWLISNPSKRKTDAGMVRFLSSWLKNSNRGGSGQTDQIVSTLKRRV